MSSKSQPSSHELFTYSDMRSICAPVPFCQRLLSRATLAALFTAACSMSAQTLPRVSLPAPHAALVVGDVSSPIYTSMRPIQRDAG
jgi:hypothetical protein